MLGKLGYPLIIGAAATFTQIHYVSKEVRKEIHKEVNIAKEDVIKGSENIISESVKEAVETGLQSLRAELASTMDDVAKDHLKSTIKEELTPVESANVDLRGSVTYLMKKK